MKAKKENFKVSAPTVGTGGFKKSKKSVFCTWGLGLSVYGLYIKKGGLGLWGLASSIKKHKRNPKSQCSVHGVSRLAFRN